MDSNFDKVDHFLVSRIFRRALVRGVRNACSFVPVEGLRLARLAQVRRPGRRCAEGKYGTLFRFEVSFFDPSLFSETAFHYSAETNTPLGGASSCIDAT